MMAQSPRNQNKSKMLAQKVVNQGPPIYDKEHKNQYGYQNEPLEINYKNGATYKGKHKDHLRDGYGELKTGNVTFDGFFKENRFVSGKLTYSDTCWFDGTFENEQFKHGTFHNNSVEYRGSFKGQTMVGEFSVKWPSNIKYVGPVSNNKLNGKGVMTFPDGVGNIKQVEGTWENDQLIQCDLLTMHDGSTADNFQV